MGTLGTLGMGTLGTLGMGTLGTLAMGMGIFILAVSISASLRVLSPWIDSSSFSRREW